MADGVDVTPGTGKTIATDDVGGVQYQVVKVDLGGDGVASPLVRGQQTAANSLPVTLPSDQAALPVTDNSGSLTVDGTVAVSGVSGTVTVDFPAQGDDSTDVTGPMIQGVVGEVPPEVVDAEIRPLSLTESGRLRVSATTEESASPDNRDVLMAILSRLDLLCSMCGNATGQAMFARGGPLN